MAFHCFTQRAGPGQQLPAGRRVELRGNISGTGMNTGGLNRKIDESHRNILGRFARLVGCPPECRHLGFKVLADGSQKVAVIWNCRKIFRQNVKDVCNSVQACSCFRGFNHP